MLAKAITTLEANPHEPSLRRSDTFFQEVQCAAAFGPEVPVKIKHLANDAIDDDQALEQLSIALLEWEPATIAKLGTTQAVDVVHGGVKVNALPESVYAIVNHRIAEHRCVPIPRVRSMKFKDHLLWSSVSKLQDRIIELMQPIAVQYNLTFHAFGARIAAGSGEGGQLVLTDAFDTALEPAPTTPTIDSLQYEVLVGTIMAALLTSPNYEGSRVVVQPTLGLGKHGFPTSVVGNDV